MDLLEFIAENTYQDYLAQNTDTTYTKSLQKALDETDRAINNLLRAIEAGIFNESTKERMNELEEQKKDLRAPSFTMKIIPIPCVSGFFHYGRSRESNPFQYNRPVDGCSPTV